MTAQTNANAVAPVVEVTDLTKDYADVRAVDHLTFSVAAGSVTGFLGPNGSGKSTTLRALLGLIEPTGGTARIAGCRYRDLGGPAEPGRCHARCDSPSGPQRPQPPACHRG